MATGNFAKGTKFWFDFEKEKELAKVSGDDLSNKVQLGKLARAMSNFATIINNKHIPTNIACGNASFTDGKTITVSADISKPRKYDIACGLVLHEASHIKLSDFELLRNLQNDFRYDMTRMLQNSPDYNTKSKLVDMIFNSANNTNMLMCNFKDIINVIEDRRIDRYMMDNNRGYLEYYKALQNEHFDSPMIKKFFDDKRFGKTVNATLTQRIQGYMFYIINISSVYFTPDQYKVLPRLENIVKIIDVNNINRLKNTTEAKEVSKEVLLEVLLGILEQQEKEQKQQAEQEQEQKQQEKNKGEESGEGGSGEKTESGEESEKSKSEKSKSEKSSGDGNETESNKSDEKSKSKSNVSETEDETEENESSNSDETEENESSNSDETEETEAPENKESGNAKSNKSKKVSETTNTDNGDGSESNAEESTEEIESTTIIENMTDEELEEVRELMKKQSDYVSHNIQKSTVGKNTAMEIEKLSVNNINLKETDIPNVKVLTVINPTDSQFTDSSTNPFYSNWRTAKNSVLEGINMGKMLSKKLKTRVEENSLTTNHLRSGYLDKRRIAAAGYGMEDVFSQKSISSYSPAEIHFTLDGSGSMTGSKWTSSIRLLAAMGEAFSSISNITFKLSLRGTDNKGKEPIIVQIFDSSTMKYRKLFERLGSIAPNGTTPEGLCYNAISNIIAKGTSNKESYFVNISDGEPYFTSGLCNYSGEFAANHTNKEWEKLKKNGVNCMSYFISDSYSPTTKHNIFDKCYGKDASYIDTANVSEIAKTINTLLMKKSK